MQAGRERLWKPRAGLYPAPNKDQVSSALNRLSEVCDGGDFRNVYHLARSTYASPLDLLEELDLLMRLLYLAESLEDIVETKAYLDGAVVQSGYRQLSFDRTSLLEEMSLPVILPSVQGWPTVRGNTFGITRPATAVLTLTTTVFISARSHVCGGPWRTLE